MGVAALRYRREPAHSTTTAVRRPVNKLQPNLVLSLWERESRLRLALTLMALAVAPADDTL
jgi:hypothetical protein